MNKIAALWGTAHMLLSQEPAEHDEFQISATSDKFTVVKVEKRERRMTILWVNGSGVQAKTAYTVFPTPSW